MDIDNVLTLDGAHGQRGGQILRTALSLSAIAMRAFRLVNLRAGRRNPGLLPQHLSAVRAAATVTNAIVSGDQFGSTKLLFTPRYPTHAGHAGIGDNDIVNLFTQRIFRKHAFEAFDVRQLRHLGIPVFCNSKVRCRRRKGIGLSHRIQYRRLFCCKLAAASNEAGFDPRKYYTLAAITTEINRKPLC